MRIRFSEGTVNALLNLGLLKPLSRVINLKKPYDVSKKAI